MAPSGDLHDSLYSATNGNLCNEATKLVAWGETCAVGGPFENGRYRVVADGDCFILQGGSDVTIAAGSPPAASFLPLDVIENITVSGTADNYLAVLGREIGFTINAFVTKL